jgi:hypothetical protein
MSSTPHKPPRCFDSAAQYNTWRHLLTYSGNNIPSGYCTDCTPAFKARMEACGRCQWPLTTFAHEHISGALIGVRNYARSAA